EGHTGGVMAVALSRDGKHALSGGFDMTVRLWEVSSGKTLRVCNTGTWIKGLGFAPDGRRFLSAGHDGVLRLWDSSTGKEVHRGEGHRGVIWGAVFLPSGRGALTVSNDQTMCLWRLPR